MILILKKGPQSINSEITLIVGENTIDDTAWLELKKNPWINFLLEKGILVEKGAEPIVVAEVNPTSADAPVMTKVKKTSRVV